MDFTPILQAVVALVGALITAFVVPYIHQKTTAQQRETVGQYVRIAVVAAEQVYNGSGKGDEKKQAVLDFLSAQGIHLNKDIIDKMIEAAVYELTNFGTLMETK